MGAEGLKNLEKFLTLYTDTSVVSQHEVTKDMVEAPGGFVKVKRHKCAWASAARFCNFPSISWVPGDRDKKVALFF